MSRRARGWLRALVATGALGQLISHLFFETPSRLGESLYMSALPPQSLAVLIGLFAVPISFVRTRRAIEARGGGLV